MTGFASVAFPHQAQRQPLHRDGKIVGSRLAAQAVHVAALLPRAPVGTAPAYNAGATTFLNLGPTNPDLAKLVAGNAQAILKLERPYNPGLTIHDIPVDAVVDLGLGHRPGHLAGVRRAPVAPRRRRTAPAARRPCRS